jgi:hypothetical protein
MALIHQATLLPPKLELLAEWLPGRSWFTGPADALERVAAYRFDDPVGEVGIETILVRAGDGSVWQVPLTYRGAPLDGDDERLLATAEHSVLGKRWIYDGTGDPVYAAALASAILGNTGQAEEYMEGDDGLQRRQLSMDIASDAAAGTSVPAVGSVLHVADGDPTVVTTDTVELAIHRRLDTAAAGAGTVLTGTWPGQATPVPLATASGRTDA